MSTTLSLKRSMSALLALMGVAILLFLDPGALFASGVDLEATKAALEKAPQEIQWGTMSMELFGGLALFLFGMEQMTDSLKAIAGTRMKNVLAKLTTNRVTGVFTGAFLTAIIQSSSVTTVLVVGFVSAGLLSLTQSIGIIFGAEIGTTITAQIIAFKVTKYALIMIIIGFLMSFLGRSDNIRGIGKIVLGLGLVFFGMTIMSDAMKPLRTYQPFLNLMVSIENPIVGIMVTATFTALIQSSSATTGIIIVMASQGFITLTAGIALAFGANIGTCATALLASIGKPRTAVRTAFVHITHQSLGVLIWVSFIPIIAQVVTFISPVAEGLTGAAKLAAETPRQIANAHTLFNCLNMLTFLPFVPVMAKWVTWLVPDAPHGTEVKKGIPARKLLGPEILETPALAMSLVRIKILQHMGVPTKEMYRDVLPAVLDGDADTLTNLQKRDDIINDYYDRILYYLREIGGRPLHAAQTREFNALMTVTNDMEDLADAIKLNIVHLGHERLRTQVTFSDEAKAFIMRFHQETLDALDDCLKVIASQDKQVLQRLINRLSTIQELSKESLERTSKDLISSEEETLDRYRIEMELYDKFRWIYFRTKRIATEATSLPSHAEGLTDSNHIFPNDMSPTTNTV
jgi:phosphate:Na+ symporter